METISLFIFKFELRKQKKKFFVRSHGNESADDLFFVAIIATDDQNKYSFCGVWEAVTVSTMMFRIVVIGSMVHQRNGLRRTDCNSFVLDVWLQPDVFYCILIAVLSILNQFTMLLLA